jgi:hypothetical protein
MAKLMIMCPEKKTPVFTGMNLDKETFEKLRNFRGYQVVCPRCAAVHRFAKADLFPDSSARAG